jgi:hypothetical protein
MIVIAMTIWPFLIFTISTFVLLLREKKEKVRELLKMMGMRESLYWASWFINLLWAPFWNALVFAIISAFLIFKHSDPFLVFLLFFSFGSSLVAFGILLSTLLESQGEESVSLFHFVLLFFSPFVPRLF